MEDDLGQIAYEAYSNNAQGISLVSGKPLPSWEDQAEEIKEAWRAAARAVINVFPKN